MTDPIFRADGERGAASPAEAPAAGRPRFCSLPPMPAPELPHGLGPMRARAIIETQYKWLNGTVIHYFFFDRDGEGADGEYVRLRNGIGRAAGRERGEA